MTEGAARAGRTGRAGRPAGARLRRAAAGLALAALAGCAQPPGPLPPGPALPRPDAAQPAVIIAQGALPGAETPRSAQGQAALFVGVMRSMEPAVERECMLRRRSALNCDFQFVVDDRPGLEPNAFQTLDSAGRPIIGFTLSLIAATRNADELAFVVGHEASHHILNHIEQKSGAATAGAVILSGIAAASGGDATAIRVAQQMGARFGAQYYSKDWELQADYLGAIIALDAGFDPVRGARFFERLPDPGDRVLGSHPSTMQRQARVAQAVADVNTGRAR